MSEIKPKDQEKQNSDNEPMFKLANETNCLHIKDEEVSRQAKEEINQKSEELIDHVPSDGSEQKENNCTSDTVVNRHANTNENSEKIIDHAPSDSSAEKPNSFTSERVSQQTRGEINEQSEELIDHVSSDSSKKKQNNFSKNEGAGRHTKKETNEETEELIDLVPSDGNEQKDRNLTSDEEVNQKAEKERKENSEGLMDHVPSDGGEQKHNNFTSDSSQTCTCSVHPKIVRYIKDALMNTEKLVPYLQKKNLSELAQLLDEPCTCNQSTKDKLFRELIEFIENNKIVKTASPMNSPQDSELNLLKNSKEFKDSMSELLDNVLNIIFLQLSGDEIDLTLKNMSQCPSNASMEVQNFVYKDIISQCKLSDEFEEGNKAIVKDILLEGDSKENNGSIARNPGKCNLETARCSNDDITFTNNKKDFCNLSMGYSKSSCSISENSTFEEINERNINTIKVTNQNIEPITGNNEISNAMQQNTDEYNLLSHSSTSDMLETNFNVGDNPALHTHSILCECIPHEGGAAVALLGASESAQLSNTANNHNLDVLKDKVDNEYFENEAYNEDNVNDMNDSSSADITFCRNIMWSFGSSDSGFENTDTMGPQNSEEIIGDDISQPNQMSNADMSMTNSELLAVRTSQSSSDTTESVQTDLVLGPKLMSESLNSCANCGSISTTDIQDTEESESNTNIKKLVSTSLNEIFLQKLPENDTLEDDDEEEDDEAEENIRGTDALNSWQPRWTKKPETRRIKRCPKEFSIHFNCLEGYSYHSPDQNETPPADKIICGPDPYYTGANREKQCDIINIKPFSECPYPSQIILVEDIKKTESQPLKTVTPQIFAVVNLPMSFFNIPKRIQSCIYLTPLQMAQLEDSDSEDGFDKQSKSMPVIRSNGKISMSGIHIDQISCRNEYNTARSKQDRGRKSFVTKRSQPLLVHQ